MGLRYTAMPSGGNAPPGYGQIIDPSAPGDDTDSELKQPAYSRGAANFQTSERLREFQGCVQGEMVGESGSRDDIRSSFASAASTCED